MRNYPPGVTGNEWQIAGPDEREMSVECPTEGFTVRTLTQYGVNQIEATIEGLRAAEGAISRQTAVYRLRLALGDLQTTDVDTECGFAGDVTIFRTDGPWTWECPVCRTMHEIEDD